MRRVYGSADLSGKDPQWYWKGGLHDAKVVSIEAVELSYDYREKNPIRNCFKLHLDASRALYNRNVKCITLWNYRILCDGSAEGGYIPGSLNGCHWMQDILKYENGKYILEITLFGKDDFPFTIRFDNAQLELR